MKSVTFSLINWPTGVSADRWVMAFGPALFRPPSDPAWLFPDSVPLDSDLAVQLRDNDTFYRVAVLADYVEVDTYISTSAFTFEDGHSYQFDARTDTLTNTTEAPVEADWLDSLVSFWAGLSNTMATWSANSQAWVWPLNIVAPLVVGVSAIVNGIFSAFFDFRVFWRAFALHVADLLDWDEIVDRLSDVLDHVAAVWAWFSDWVSSVGDVISNWWLAVSDTVLAWIATATEGLPELLAAWDNFWTVIFPGLFDLDFAVDWWQGKLVDIGDLINSAFTERADLWAGWSDLRQGVSDFFADPLEWLWSRFANWFLGSE